MAVSGEGQSYMMKKITQKVEEYWSADENTNDKFHFYYWFHRIVAELYNKDIKFKYLFGNQENAAGPHCSKKLKPMAQKMLKRCWGSLNNTTEILSLSHVPPVNQYQIGLMRNIYKFCHSQPNLHLKHYFNKNFMNQFLIDENHKLVYCLHAKVSNIFYF